MFALAPDFLAEAQALLANLTRPLTTKAHARIVLTDAELATVRGILDQHLPGIPVWVFGSACWGHGQALLRP